MQKIIYKDDNIITIYKNTIILMEDDSILVDVLEDIEKIDFIHLLDDSSGDIKVIIFSKNKISYFNITQNSHNYIDIKYGKCLKVVEFKGEVIFLLKDESESIILVWDYKLGRHDRIAIKEDIVDLCVYKENSLILFNEDKLLILDLDNNMYSEIELDKYIIKA